MNWLAVGYLVISLEDLDGLRLDRRPTFLRSDLERLLEGAELGAVIDRVEPAGADLLGDRDVALEGVHVQVGVGHQELDDGVGGGVVGLDGRGAVGRIEEIDRLVFCEITLTVV